MRIQVLVGIIALYTALAPASSPAAVAPTPDEMADARQWVAANLEGAGEAVPFFSFTYDGKPSAELLPNWEVRRASRAIDDHKTERTIEYRDPATDLQVRAVAVEYTDFPTVEWTLYFKNTGERDTPILADVRAMDLRIAAGPEEKYTLHHNQGTTVQATDFQPLVTELPPGAQVALAPNGGRTSGGVWPYFNLQCGGKGRILVVGWPGRWAAGFQHEAGQGVRVTAGQELVHAKLLPGEEIRTPLMVQQFYHGDWQRAQNIWRRWMLAHNLPRPGGKLPPPRMTPCSSHQFAEMTKADEASQIQFIDRYVEEGIKIDYWWMDAGWYPCGGNWPVTGTWEVDKTRFPRGLRAVSDHAKSKEIKTIVWFEPERVAGGTWLAENHPEWILGGQLLNLGNPDALAWLSQHVSKMITDEGIGLYRQDYNIDPLPFWRGNDAPDRQGMTENAYVVGYLAYWDSLRRDHPDMLIDSCASGGHRNDLETMRRAVPLLRSDYIFEPIGQQGHTYGLAYWLPFFGTGEMAVDPYVFRSCMCAGNIPCWDMRNKDLDYGLLRKLSAQWRAVAPCYFGDYYPLTPYNLAPDAWIAWQFDRPEEGDGLVQAFRRPECVYESARLQLRGLDPDATYDVQNLDERGVTKMTGKELAEPGLLVVMKNRPEAVLIVYKRVRE
ncbi:MAG: alpha-galactosidase [Pirellulales bacterium]|nr:alpha-galactosidase [Pirellulales bacterium]